MAVRVDLSLRPWSNSIALKLTGLHPHVTTSNLEDKTLFGLLGDRAGCSGGLLIQLVNACQQICLICNAHLGSRAKEIERRTFALEDLTAILGRQPVLFVCKV